jgi:hypothetical protein
MKTFIEAAIELANIAIDAAERAGDAARVRRLSSAVGLLVDDRVKPVFRDLYVVHSRTTLDRKYEVETARGKERCGCAHFRSGAPTCAHVLAAKIHQQATRVLEELASLRA